MRKNMKYMISRDSAAFHSEKIEVMHDLECLHIEISYPQTLQYMSFIMVYDEKGNVRMQKLLGYGEQKLAIGTSGETTSIGAVAGAVNTGTWTIQIGLFKEYVERKMGDDKIEMQILVTDETMEITEPIGSFVWTKEEIMKVSVDHYDWNEIYDVESRWYRGDFHTHTTLSDGKETVRNAMKKAKDMGLDFYVPTEHNLMHTGWCDKDLCILPGTEITTNIGHFNIFGIEKMPSQMATLLTSSDMNLVGKEINKIIKEAGDNGEIISINHPFLTEWKWLVQDTPIADIHCLEIINDPTYTDAKESNNMAIEFLDELWNDGHTVYGIGGSDSHYLIEERYEGSNLPSIVGDPTTHVYCHRLTPNRLMEAVKKGQMCITRFCQLIPEILIDDEIIIPGHRVNLGAKGTYKLQVVGQQEKPHVSFIMNGKHCKMAMKQVKADTYEGTVTFEMDDKDWSWVRIEVRDNQGEFLGYVNPIYAGKKKHRYQTFGEVKGYAERIGAIHD